MQMMQRTGPVCWNAMSSDVQGANSLRQQALAAVACDRHGLGVRYRWRDHRGKTAMSEALLGRAVWQQGRAKRDNGRPEGLEWTVLQRYCTGKEDDEEAGGWYMGSSGCGR